MVQFYQPKGSRTISANGVSQRLVGLFYLVILDQALSALAADAALGADPQAFADFLEIVGTLIQCLINLLVGYCFTDADIHKEEYPQKIISCK